MRFLLRCTFWLSVVWASIFWHGGMSARPDLRADALAAVQSMTRGATEKATSELAGYCRSRPTECARDALRLTALVETTGAGGGAEAAPAARRMHDARMPRSH